MVLLAYIQSLTSVRRLDAECAPVPTLEFDTLIDAFFLVDIALTFQTGIITPGTGEYIDDRVSVRLSQGLLSRFLM